MVLRGRASLVLAVLLFGHSAWTIARSTAQTSIAPYLYISEAELAALRFLDAQPRGLTLSAPVSGNAIPWLAGKPVVAGHWFLTPNIDEKVETIVRFFDPEASPAWKRSVLSQLGVRYVYAGPVESQLGDIDPRLGLLRIYDAGGVRIFSVPDTDHAT